MKERLDVLLVKRGLAPSREKAKAMIMEGNVFVNNNREDKAGSTFPEDCAIEIHGKVLPYVSRGGLKLERAIERFDISLEGAVCMDIGASTGGFTDCMLQNGAVKVYSVDVGYGQFAWKLRQDPRVVCMEKTNIRYVTPEDISDVLDFASVDVSFISLTKVLLPARELLKNHGRMVCLIKPQFEAGREKVGKKGVVRDRKVHEEVIRKVVDFGKSAGFSVLGLEYSPIKGPEGNIEYLIYLEKNCAENMTGMDSEAGNDEGSRTGAEAGRNTTGIESDAVNDEGSRTGAEAGRNTAGIEPEAGNDDESRTGAEAGRNTTGIEADAVNRMESGTDAETGNGEGKRITEPEEQIAIAEVVDAAHRELDG